MISTRRNAFAPVTVSIGRQNATKCYNFTISAACPPDFVRSHKLIFYKDLSQSLLALTVRSERWSETR